MAPKALPVLNVPAQPLLWFTATLPMAQDLILTLPEAHRPCFSYARGVLVSGPASWMEDLCCSLMCHPWLCLCPFLLSNAPPGWTLSWLICCFACGCQWTLTAAWCVQTLWDRSRAAPLSWLPGILGSCFEIKQLWVCTEWPLSNVK